MKKILALVLALTMVLGMMAVPASAKFDDAADIQYVEAVDVVAACGIIEGYNNEFNPQGELTRAAGAKLVAYLELGAKQAEALTAEKAPFADVPADHWAAGYIGWAAAKGYLAGVGDNNFAPDAPLSAIAYAKLMLCALGYDASIEGFTGNGWEYNVMALALDEAIDLFDGNDDADFAAVATREEAALYTFNALQAGMVKYDSKGTKVEINGAVISTGADAATSAGTTLMGKWYKDLKLTGTADAFNRPANVWKYDGESVGTYAKTPVATYTKAVKGGDIYTALDKPAAASTDYKVYENGNDTSVALDKIASVAKKDDGTFTIASGEKDTIGGNGTLIEIYERNLTEDEVKAGKIEQAYIIVIVNTYVGQITDWSAAEVDSNGDVTTKEKVEVSDLAGKKVGEFETTAFEKADKTDKTVVYYTYDVQGKAIKAVKAADYVEDVAVTGQKAGSNVTYNGKTVSYAAGAYDAKTALTLKDATYTVYTDAYGYVLFVDTYTAAASEDYVMVLDITDVGKTTDDFSSKYYKTVKYIAMDGTVSTAKVIVSAKDAAVIMSDKKTELKDQLGTWVTLSEDEDNDGYMVVDALDGATQKDGSKIEKVSAKVPTIASGIVANAKTVFVLKTDSDPTTYKTVTGIANMPGYEFSKKDGAAYAVIDDNYAVVVYMDVSADSVTASDSKAEDMIYLLDASSTDVHYDAAADANYYVYSAIVDGEKVSVKAKSAKLAEAAGLYEITAYDTNGWIKTVDTVKNSAAETVKLTADYSEPVLTIGGKTLSAYTVASNASVVLIDADKAVELGEVADLDADLDGVLTLVFEADDDATVVAIYFQGEID